jgi:hypothetical protein
MTDEEKLAAIRHTLNQITQRTCWDAYDLAREVVDFIDGTDKYTIFN